MAPQIPDQSVRAARRVYLWLLLAPIIAIPCWLVMLSSFYNAGPGEYLGASLMPLIFYVPIFFWAFSSDSFLRAHARQGLVLLALRFAAPLTSFALLGADNSAGVFLLVNGSLWLFGSLIGLGQAASRKSTIPFDPGQVPPEPETPPAGKKRTPHDLLAQTGPLRQQGRRAEAVAILLDGFRSDDAAVRKLAEQVLAEMGEVETF